MIACQLALNHFVVLFVQNNSQMPRFSSFKNVFLPNGGKKVTHRVFESRNNFRLLFYHEFFAFIALVTRNCRPKSEAFTFYDTNLPIRSDKSRKRRQSWGGRRKRGRKMEKKILFFWPQKNQRNASRLIGLATYFTPPAANHLIRTRVR